MRGVASQADIDRLSATDPDTLDWPQTSYEIFTRAAETYPQRRALTYFPDPSRFSDARHYNFAELLQRITQAANLFIDTGVGPGDVVCYSLPNIAHAHFALWGAEAAGIAMAVNPALAPTQIITLLGAADAKVLVTTPDLWKTISPRANDLPALTTVFIVGTRDDDASQHTAQVLDFDQAAAAQPGDALHRTSPPAADDECSWFCTGGTTGAPKIARRQHRAETGNALTLAVALGNHLSEESVFLCGLPLFHVNAIAATGLAPWSAGAEVVLAGPAGYREPALLNNFWKIVEHYKVTFFSGVPTIYARLLEQPIAGADIGSLDSAICGAAPLPTELFRRFEKTTGVRILEGYGLTEGACVSTLNPIDGERRIGSIGLSLPWQNTSVVELADDGSYIRDCAPDEIGSIVIAGKNLFLGYRDPTHETGIWVDRGDTRRWLNTGDLGRRDADGYFWLTGRRKELIIRGGHNIDPASIEEPLNTHPAVAMTAAVARPDKHSGEVPVVYVQLRAGEIADAGNLLDYARKHIAEHAAVPKAIYIVPELPLTAVGKIFKPQLVFKEIERIVREEAAAVNTQLTDVSVRSDSKRGTIARIKGPHVSATLKKTLSAYAFQTDYVDE